MGCPSLRSTTPTPTLDASYLTLNVLEKLGRTRSGALINFDFRVAKAFV